MARHAHHPILSKMLAALLIVAILLVGMDIHDAGAAAVRHEPASTVTLTQDHQPTPASDQAVGGDHYCHGCVVLVPINGDAGQGHARTAAPAVAHAAALAGMMAAPPGRPPRTAIPVI